MRLRTCSVFADEVVLCLAVVVVPLEHVEAALVGRSRRLVVHDHAHLVATRRLVQVPVPTTQHVLRSVV